MDTTRPVPQYLSLVTLGVGDVAASRAFCKALGPVSPGFEKDDVVFFDMKGTVLALDGRAALADDAGLPSAGEGFRAAPLAFNLESEADVDYVIAHTEACGAHITKPPLRAARGGYSGYFADPDGHLWEGSYNPAMPLSGEVRLVLRPPKPC